MYEPKWQILALPVNTITLEGKKTLMLTYPFSLDLKFTSIGTLWILVLRTSILCDSQTFHSKEKTRKDLTKAVARFSFCVSGQKPRNLYFNNLH